MASHPPDTPDYRLTCLWGDRLQDAQSCAHSLAGFLSALGPLCPTGTTWHTLGRKNARQPLLTNDVDTLRETVLQPGNGSRPGAPPHATFPEVGFNALLVSGEGPESCAIRLAYGMRGPHATNELVIELPRRGKSAQSWLEPGQLDTLFAACLRFWQPDLAYVHHTDMRDKDVGYPLPIYWFAYNRAWIKAMPTLPHPAQTRQVEGVPGHYLVTTAERYTRFNDAHMATSEAVKSCLKNTGLLPPGAPFL